jgi:hypothetical protein
MNCHTFSTGLSSGHLGGSVMMVTLAGTTRHVDMCQPAWSVRRTVGRGFNRYGDLRKVLVHRFGIAVTEDVGAR